MAIRPALDEVSEVSAEANAVNVASETIVPTNAAPSVRVGVALSGALNVAMSAARIAVQSVVRIEMPSAAMPTTVGAVPMGDKLVWALGLAARPSDRKAAAPIVQVKETVSVSASVRPSAVAIVAPIVAMMISRMQSRAISIHSSRPLIDALPVRGVASRRALVAAAVPPSVAAGKVVAATARVNPIRCRPRWAISAPMPLCVEAAGVAAAGAAVKVARAVIPAAAVVRAAAMVAAIVEA